MKRKKRAVIVLGNHRTGSSCIAGILHTLGVHMGHTMVGPTECNKKGHFEDSDLVAYNTRLMRTEKPEEDVAYEAARELFQTKSREFDLWGIKDPRLCLTIDTILPLVQDTVDEVLVVVPLRPYECSVASLSKRDKISPDFARSFLDVYEAGKREFLAATDLDVMSVDFTSLVEHPEDCVGRLARFVLRDMVSPAEQEKRIQVAAKFVEPKLVTVKEEPGRLS